MQRVFGTRFITLFRFDQCKRKILSRFLFFIFFRIQSNLIDVREKYFQANSWRIQILQSQFIEKGFKKTDFFVFCFVFCLFFVCSFVLCQFFYSKFFEDVSFTVCDFLEEINAFNKLQLILILMQLKKNQFTLLDCWTFLVVFQRSYHVDQMVFCTDMTNTVYWALFYYYYYLFSVIFTYLLYSDNLFYKVMLSVLSNLRDIT